MALDYALFHFYWITESLLRKEPRKEPPISKKQPLCHVKAIFSIPLRATEEIQKRVSFFYAVLKSCYKLPWRPWSSDILPHSTTFTENQPYVPPDLAERHPHVIKVPRCNDFPASIVWGLATTPTWKFPVL